MLILKLGNRARGFLERLLPKHFGQIDTKILMLRENPFPQDSKFVKGTIYHRVDSGEYRIIYRVIGNILDVPLVGKRNDDEVYKKLKRMG